MRLLNKEKYFEWMTLYLFYYFFQFAILSVNGFCVTKSDPINRDVDCWNPTQFTDVTTSITRAAQS